MQCIMTELSDELDQEAEGLEKEAKISNWIALGIVILSLSGVAIYFWLL